MLIFQMSLYKHQIEAVETLSKWIEPKNGITGGILAFKMGLGKTRTMLELIKREKKSCLVICAKSNIQVWTLEIKKAYPELKYLVLHSEFIKTPNRVDLETINKYNIVITTYEVVRSQFTLSDPKCFLVKEYNYGQVLNDVYRQSEVTKQKLKIQDVVKGSYCRYSPIYSQNWHIIIADESHRFSNLTSKIYYAMVALKAKVYYCLSGTPIVNYDKDLYSSFKFAGLNNCHKKEWDYSVYWNFGLNERVISKDYSETDIVLPKANVETILISLNTLEKQYYNYIVDRLKGEYAQFKKGDATFSAPLAMFTRLRQVCIASSIIPLDFLQDENGDVPEFLIEMSQNILFTKIKIICKIIKKTDGKIVIFSSFVSALNIIRKKLESKKIPVLQLDGKVTGIDREKIIELFNNNEKYKVFLSSYKAGGVGINLTSANTVILVEPWWNSATEEQAICRTHRIGQTRPVVIYSLIADKTFETYLIQVQKRKSEISKQYFEGQEQYRKFDDKTIVELIENVVFNGYI